MAKPEDMKEIWKPIKGFEDIYSVSNLGKIRRDGIARGSKVGRILSLCVGSNGYYAISLHNKKNIKYTIPSNLVAQAFLGKRPKGYVINHMDGNKLNNRVDNLEYTTYSRNIIHALDLGLRNGRGENHYMTKLTNKDVINIRNIYASGKIRQFEIANKYSISSSLLNNILKRKSWTHC